MNEITVTEACRVRLNEILDELRYPGDFRLSVKGSGCSGLMYVLTPSEKHDPLDERFLFDSFAVVVDEESMKYVAGTEIDYVAEGLNTVFKFNNPNASSQCGCGESFTIKELPVQLK